MLIQQLQVPSTRQKHTFYTFHIVTSTCEFIYGTKDQYTDNHNSLINLSLTKSSTISLL